MQGTIIMTIDSEGEPIGEYLRQLRMQQQLSIAKVASLTGLSANTIRWMERGVTQPKPESLKLLAAALKVNYEVLLLRAGYLEQADVLTDEERELLRLYHDLSAGAKQMLLEVLGLVARMNKVPETEDRP